MTMIMTARFVEWSYITSRMSAQNAKGNGLSMKSVRPLMKVQGNSTKNIAKVSGVHQKVGRKIYD
ncbi:hypothetical protein [Enterococcus raffinosus]|uniref:Uncharacterized protein n=1 Tax=Enterococcus raffinosus TaxID=71452 RepID=A0AAW8TC20_9ENTE|nr:hypothetical protein [Enterococcus raffinosus]MDT2526004.1 hypothetical protein [Enterococcus raffinosus]MDT2532183.1 hypothetical protein [Enterococcus raffinosus]MDT2536455.1 hypothetical protein [Enterococcus raffinosus]MDT2545339.1 hypothetical protein [Enterococcus raffinosus]MDT2555655.1 hypothetical protein [Enterococcus raffinosus]